VGIQGHSTHTRPPGDYPGDVARRGSPGLIPVRDTFTSSMARNQADRYRTCFRIFRECSPGISAVVFRGLSDPASWLNTHPDERPDRPLLFDAQYEPKEALPGVMGF